MAPVKVSGLAAFEPAMPGYGPVVHLSFVDGGVSAQRFNEKDGDLVTYRLDRGASDWRLLRVDRSREKLTPSEREFLAPAEDYR